MQGLAEGVIDEKRRSERVFSRIPLQYRKMKGAGEEILQTRIKDISDGGLKFMTNEFLSLACRLIVEISMPTTPRHIKAISKIAWIRKVDDGHNYEIGTQFLDMAREDKKEIELYIKSLLSLDI